MRLRPKWIIGATAPIAAGVLAAAVAAPAMAQPSGGQHHAPALHRSSGAPQGVPKYTPAKAVPSTDNPTTAGPTGKTRAEPGPTLVPVSGKPDPACVTMATAKPVNLTPVVVGPTGTTGPAPS